MSERERNDAREPYLKPGEFYGAVVSQYERGGVVLSELTHAGARLLPRHTHGPAYFCLLLDGAYSEQVGRRTVEYAPFTATFHPPGLTHRDRVGAGGGRFLIAEVPEMWLERLRECGARAPDFYADAQGGELVWLAARLYREYTARDALSPLAVEGLVLEMLALAARAHPAAGKRPPHWLARAVELLHSDFRRRLTIGEVAAAVGVHPFHLSKVFRQFKGQSIADYVRGLRAHHACVQLTQQPRATLAEVALEAGFADQSHFARTFRRVTGMTPGDFRRALAEGRESRAELSQTPTAARGKTIAKSRGGS